ncbi:MAG TPA: hypothetical protein VGL59_09640 [Polyangia bacterium]
MPQPNAAPIPQEHLEVMKTFIKHESCTPTTCDKVTCQSFSDGMTKGLPSHVVRCRWIDDRAGKSETPNRCAYVHYSVDAKNQGYGNLFLSTPSSGETCQTDSAFSERIKDTQGYSGAVP